MRTVRQWHTYLSIFFAPAIFFFAFSGLLQTIGLHEARGSTTYHPPAWIVALSSLHKDQVLGRGVKNKPRPVNAKPDMRRASGPTRERPKEEEPFVPLKAFVLALALGLMTTAILGITIALRNPAMRRATLILLGAGTLVPLLLILF